MPRIVRRSDRPPERSFGLGSCAGVPVARHPAKVSSSSAAVPHHCGLLPSCRSSPPVTRAFARVPVKLHSDRGHRIAADPGWTARLPPASSLAAFLPRSATSVGRRSSGIGAASRFRARSLDLRVRPPTLASPRGDRARSGSLRGGLCRGALLRPLGRGRCRRVRCCSRSSVPARPPFGGPSRFRVGSVTEDSLARWISGPARILGIRVGSVVPSPSVDARSGASTGRLQGVSPPTSPGVFRVPCDLRTTCSFLGFVSPSRLSRASDDTSREVAATVRSPGRSSRLRLPFSLR